MPQYNRRAAEFPHQPPQRFQVLLRIFPQQSQYRLRRQAEFVGNRNADAAHPKIEAQYTRWHTTIVARDRRESRILEWVKESKGHPLEDRNSGFVRRFFLLLVLVLLAAAGAVAYALLVPTGPRTETFVDILPGTSGAKIARQLRDQGIIRSWHVFLALRMLRGGSLKAGEYRFDHPVPMEEVLDRLHRGDVYTLALTIPEGSNVFDIAARVEAAGLGSKAAFVEAAKQDVWLIGDLDPTAPSLEGYLFPDTYRFTRHIAPQEIMATMVRRFRQAAQQIGLKDNDHRIVTLASLVEKETPIDSERPLVASVFENRLAKGMPLMTDPSVIYAALLLGRYRGTIYQSDLQADSAYNTYRHAGLPPGPICNPGLKSLEAALHPAQTNFLYFVAASADPSGKSRFSATLEEHAKDVEAYRRAVRNAAQPQ